ncbi:MAG: protein kinase [Alphaproteobacteria bacterium]|nr:protein kinase [Alphaproteobacteria bacterium]
MIRELGAGHFGTVVAAVGEVPGRGLSAGKRRLVAIKKLNEGADDHSRDLLQQEFALLDQVKHRCIVRVYEYLEDENAVVMEYIHGVTLRRMLDECARAREQVFTDAAIEITCELADALYQAWTIPGDNGEALQLVHRDLKPENIMVTPQGEVKILDFGLARVDNTDFAPDDSDRIKGTPIYMAPEQASGQDVDHRSDLFSVGLIAYELFMNRPAYVLPQNSRDPLGEIFDAIERGALVDECRELETKLPSVGPILSRLLQANPRARYQTGQDLLVDLKRQLYRDRGSYLKEFAEFFFGSIFDLADPPEVRGGGRASSSGSAPAGNRQQRLTMEERLKASMAREANARRAASKPSTWKDTAPAAPPPASGRSGGGRAETWTPGAATPPRRSGGDGKPGPKMLGARSPDETGMLQMVSLTDKVEEAAKSDPSATAFFAIPAPKSDKRAQPVTPVVTPPSNPIGLPGPPIVGPTPGIQPIGQPIGGPVVQGPVISGPVASGPQAGAIAQGPVANTPFQVAGGGAAPPPADAEQRTQSNRVYAIVLAMFFLVGVAIFAAVWFRPTGDAVADAPSDPPPVVKEEPSKDRGKRRTVDTGTPAAEEDIPKEAPKVSRPPRTPSTTPKSTSSSAGPGTVAVKLGGGTEGTTSVEVTCPSGFRQRGRVSGGSASVTGVPSENCTLHFKGGAPAKFAPVRGGQSLNCSIIGTTAQCQ